MPVAEATAAAGAGTAAVGSGAAGAAAAKIGGALAGAGSIIGAGISGLWNNITGLTATRETNRQNKEIALWNMLQQQETNKQNYGMFKENLDYQKALNQQIMEREDTSYQRTVADMRAAGLSPLTMTGTNGSGGSVANVEPYSQEPITNNYQPETFRPNLQIGNLTLAALQTMNELQNYQIGEDYRRQQKAIADSAETKAKEDTMTLALKLQNARIDGMTKQAIAEDIFRNMDFNAEHGIFNGMSETDRNTRFLRNSKGEIPNYSFFMRNEKGEINGWTNDRNDNTTEYAKERVLQQLSGGVLDYLKAADTLKEKGGDFKDWIIEGLKHLK